MACIPSSTVECRPLSNLPHRHMVATLSSLFDDIDFAGLLEVVEHGFEVFLGFSIPTPHSVEPDVGDVKGNPIRMRTVAVRSVSISAFECFLLRFGTGGRGHREEITLTSQGFVSFAEFF